MHLARGPDHGPDARPALQHELTATSEPGPRQTGEGAACAEVLACPCNGALAGA